MKESWINSKFVKQQQVNGNRISAFLSLLYWFYFYGNDFNDYCTFRFWDKSYKQKKSYISLRRNDKLRFALSNPRVYEIFLDKVKFNCRFSDFIKRDWCAFDKNSESVIKEFLVNHKIAIIKPSTDYGGHGVKKIDTSNVEEYLLNPTINEGVIEECIQNDENLKKIAPGSLNTIRIVTLIDKYGKLHILASVLRMGNGTAFTDNYHDGGMACAIDPKTGKLVGNAYGMDCKEYSHHPYSEIKFDGYVIEAYKQCEDLVKQIAYVEPEARYVGWDFAVTPNGIDVIEGNIPPGEDITQIAAGRGLWYVIKELV